MKKNMCRKANKAFYQKNKLNFIVTLIVITLNSGLIVGLSYFLQKAIDLAIDKDFEQMKSIVIYGFLMIAFLVINWLIERIVRNNYVERATKQYKNMIFDHIMDKNISSFMNERTSTYVSGMSNDINQIELHYLQGTMDLILQILFFIGALFMMLWYNVSLTLLAIVLVSICGIVSLVIGKKLMLEEKNVSQENEYFVFSLKNFLEGYSLIKCFRAEENMKQLFSVQNGKLEKQKCKRRKVESLINLISSGAGLLVQTGVIFVGAKLTETNQITIGALVAFVQLMGIIIGPIQTIPKLYSNRKAAIELIKKMMSSLEFNVAVGGEKVIGNLEQGIEFKNVSFSYDDNYEILHDINLNIEKGKSYLFVGQSGCGKSTLLNLLLGGYDTYEGNITMDGTELKEISKESLYKNVSVISQHSFIFDGTIEDNITMFHQNKYHDLSEIIARSGLSKVIEDKGLDYQCGENGMNLSGGEKQRIAIARCLLIGNPIILMDEGTAALDKDTAYSVEDSILSIPELTRLVITHRLNEKLLRRYDEIIVIDAGKIAERGDYESLIQRKGYLYSMMFQHQT